MMGWGLYESELKGIANRINRDIKQYRKSDVIRFVPPAPQEELARWTAGAAIGVIPYEKTGLNHWFCTPNKLWEYPNAGVPLLISPFPEMKDFVEKYDHGWLLPEKTVPKSFGLAIGALSDADIDKAKQNSIIFIKENHWGIFEARLFSLYKELRAEYLRVYGLEY
jgi:glycosyltransferase involved in cell wall biosynthesis